MLYFFNIGNNISISPAGKIPVYMVVDVDDVDCFGSNICYGAIIRSRVWIKGSPKGKILFIC